MPEERVPLTKQAFERLKEELEYLEGDARRKTIEEIATARAHGDLSENAEYHAAKDQQGLQEARARQIRQMLRHAEIIEAEDDGVVSPGMLVTIRTNGDEPETYLFGTREEKGVGYDVLTPESPLGKALMGHTQGESVVASIPAGEMKVEIVEVKAP